jgi:hypothetical protein
MSFFSMHPHLACGHEGLIAAWFTVVNIPDTEALRKPFVQS